MCSCEGSGEDTFSTFRRTLQYWCFLTVRGKAVSIHRKHDRLWGFLTLISGKIKIEAGKRTPVLAAITGTNLFFEDILNVIISKYIFIKKLLALAKHWHKRNKTLQDWDLQPFHYDR